MTAPIGVGIIGAGFFGDLHAQALGRLDDARLVAACRSDAPALDGFVERHGGRPYTVYQDLLDDGDVEAVVIATPHATHAEITLAALRAGKQVLLEKPMAVSLAECDAIVEAGAAASRVVMVGHITHFSRAFRMAKELLQSGELGDPVAGYSSMRKMWMEPNRRSWHLDRAQGGGVLLTGGIHAVDRLTWLMGADVASVSASLATRFYEQEADDCGVLFLRHANGAAGVVFSVGYAHGAPNHETEIVCTRGVLRVHSVKGVSVGRGEQWHEVPESGDRSWMQEALELEWRDFAHSVRTGERPAITAEFGRHVMSVLFAAEASSHQRAEVRVSRASGTPTSRLPRLAGHDSA